MKRLLCTVITLALIITLMPITQASASTTMQMLHTEGTKIVNTSGDQITLRGTNLGGWLMQEGWLSPLGTGEIDHRYIRNITSSCDNGEHTAINAIDTFTENGIISNNLLSYWQSDKPQDIDNMELKIELDKARTFDTIIIETDPEHTGDYLRGGIVWVSTDGINDWTQVTNLTIDSSKKADGIIRIKTGEQTAKYISVKPSQASENGQYWAVGNISLCMSDEFTVRNHLIRRFGEDAANELIAAFQNNWITALDIKNIADMNMNFVRVPVYWMNFALSDGSIRSDSNSGFAKLDWLLSECSKYGIYVLIDFHGAPGGANGWASSGQAGTIPTELFIGDPETVQWNRDVTLNIWAAIAERYKDNPTVAAYGLLNEPVLGFSANDHLDGTKYWFYNEIYKKVRSIDQNHIVIFEEFNDWSIAENRPERMEWTNYMFEKHPYDMSNATSWDAQKFLADSTVSNMSKIQDSWNIPLLVGEFCLYYFNDIWDSFLSDLNSANISWTNWSYKARGTKYESGGGNWGYYNTYTGTDPDLMHDSYNTIKSIWQNTRTDVSFSANQALINTVSARANGSKTYPYIALDRTLWHITASDTSSNPLCPASYMIDGDSSTRWSTGTGQAAGQNITIDFGQTENFDKIELIHDGNDYPGGYKVEVSSDGLNYSRILLNNVDIGYGPKMVLVPSNPQTAQFVRISITDGSRSNYWWSILEMNVYWRNVN